MLYVDLPTLEEFKDLSAFRSDFCVSIYLPATPLSQESDATRIQLKNAAKQVRRQLEDGGFDPDRRGVALARIDELDADYEFWRLQANGLAVLATADELRTFRLANHLSETVQVADRYHLKPLLRAITFPHAAYVLALSQKEVRLVEVFADLPPAVVPVGGLPPRVAGALDKSTPDGRDNDDGIHNAEHQNRLMEQYAKQIDAALQPVLSGRDTPLILAATGRLAPVYRAANTYHRLLPDGIEDSPDRISDAELAAAARPILDAAYGAEIDEMKTLFETRRGQCRTTTDVQDAARAATAGAIDILLVDMDAEMHGSMEADTGAISFADAPGASTYDLLDEIAARALGTGARVLSVRSDDLPAGYQLAAFLHYPL